MIISILQFIVGFSMAGVFFMWGYFYRDDKYQNDIKFKGYCAMIEKIIEEYQNDNRK